MKIDWTKKPQRSPYLDYDTNKYHIVVNVPYTQDPDAPVGGELNPWATDEEILGVITAEDIDQIDFGSSDERELVLAIAWKVMLTFFGLDKSVYPWSNVADFVEIVSRPGEAGPVSPVVEPRPGGSVLYLVSTVNTADSIPPGPREDIAYVSPHHVDFKNFEDFSDRMELLAMQLEEYSEDPTRGMERPGISFTGHKNLGYGVYDFKEETEKVRSFISEMAKLFKVNHTYTDGSDPFQIGFGYGPAHVMNWMQNLAEAHWEYYYVEYVAQKMPDGSLKKLSGYDAFFPKVEGGTPLVGEGSAVLQDPRMTSFVERINDITDQILSSHDIADIGAIKVGQGCKLPPAANAEDIPIPKDFIDKYVRPKPSMGISVENPLETFDLVKKQQPTLVTKEETTIYEDYAKIGNEVVDNRNVNASDYVADAVWENLPNSPASIDQIRTVEDAFGYILNKVSIDTIVREMLICLGLNLSLDDLIDMACDKLLAAVFGDVKKVEKLLKFLQSGDSVIAMAFSKAGADPEVAAKMKGVGPDVQDLTGMLTNFVGLQQGSESLEETGDPMARFLAGDMGSAFQGDIKATKRFLCELIIVGPFAGLYALIMLIKNWRDQKEGKQKGKPKLPPQKQCDIATHIPDDNKMLDQIEKALMDMLRKEAERLLEEMVVRRLTELLYNLYAACRREDNNFGAFNSSILPLGPDSEPDDLDSCADLDFDALMDNLYSCLTPSELCSLYKGTATEDLLQFVLRYFQSETSGCPGEFSLFNMNTISKVRNYFIGLGKKADLSACVDVELDNQDGAETQQTPDLCLIGNSPKEELLARALALRGLTQEEIDEQLEIKKNMNKDVAGSLLELLTIPEDVEAEMGAETKAELAKSLEQSTSVAVDTIFDPIIHAGATDMAELVPILFSKRYDLIDALKNEVKISVVGEFSPGVDPANTEPTKQKQYGLMYYDLYDDTYSHHGFTLPINKQKLVEDDVIQQIEKAVSYSDLPLADQIKEEIELLEAMMDPNTAEYKYFHHKQYTFLPHKSSAKTAFKGTLEHSVILQRIFYRWHNFLSYVHDDDTHIFDGTGAGGTQIGLAKKYDNGKFVINDGWEPGIITLFYDTFFDERPESFSAARYFNDIDFYDPGYPAILKGEVDWRWKHGFYQSNAGFKAWRRWEDMLLDAYSDKLDSSSELPSSWSTFRDKIGTGPGTARGLSWGARDYIGGDKPWYEDLWDWITDTFYANVEAWFRAYNAVVASWTMSPKLPAEQMVLMRMRGDYSYGSRYNVLSSDKAKSCRQDPDFTGACGGPTPLDITVGPQVWYSFYWMLTVVGFAPEGKYDRTQIILNWYKYGQIPNDKELALFDLLWRRKHSSTKLNNDEAMASQSKQWRRRIEKAYHEQGAAISGDSDFLPRTGYTVPPQVITDPDFDISVDASSTTDEVRREMRFKLLAPESIDWANDIQKPIQVGYSLELYNVNKQKSDFSFTVLDDIGIFYDWENIRNDVDKVLEFANWLNGGAKPRLVTQTDDGDFQLPVEPQFLEHFVAATLVKGYNTYSDPENNFLFGLDTQSAYYKQLRNIFVDKECALLNLYCTIYRDVLIKIATKINETTQLYVDQDAFSNLNFIQADNDFMGMDSIKDHVAKNFNKGVMEATEEEPAKLLLEHMVEWPAAGAKRAMIQLKIVETCIKNIFTLLIIRPGDMFESGAMVEYIKNLTKTRLRDFTYEGETVPLNLDELSDEDLHKIIVSTAKQTSLSLDKALNQVVKPGTRQTGDSFLDSITRNIPVFDIASFSAFTEPAQAPTKDYTHLGFQHYMTDTMTESADAMANFTHTSFTQPRFTRKEDGEQMTDGFIFEKFIYYKLHDEATLRNNFKRYSLGDKYTFWRDHPGFTGNLAGFTNNGNQQQYFDVDVFAEYDEDNVSGRIEFALDPGTEEYVDGYIRNIKRIPTEFIGDPNNLGSETIITSWNNFHWLHHQWLSNSQGAGEQKMKIKRIAGTGHYFEKDLDGDGEIDMYTWIRNDFDFLDQNYRHLFAEIGIGYRLSYVMPKHVHKNNGATWYSHPLSVGEGNFWQNAMDVGLDIPTNWMSWVEQAGHSLEDLIPLKKQRAYFMRECHDVAVGDIFIKPNAAGHDISLDAYYSFPSIFVLPMVESKMQLPMGAGHFFGEPNEDAPGTSMWHDHIPGWGGTTSKEYVSKWNSDGTAKSYSHIDTTGFEYIQKMYNASNFHANPDAITHTGQSNWRQLKKEIYDHPMFKILFTLVFPIDKLLVLMAIRNSVAFEESVRIFSDACLRENMFPVTQKQILFLLDYANSFSNEKDAYNSSFDYSSDKEKMVGLADEALERYKKSLTENLTVTSLGCSIRQEQIGQYIIDKKKAAEQEEQAE